ncbi:MAG: hypothetical protein OEU26_10605 [Candidatus Tectomicrobia bacterium]|nr:hypothetical protein [Candidatus Tectomicrobia bacterium]
MRPIRLMLCLLVVVLSGCTSTFNGYRSTPLTPAEILQQGDSLDEDYPATQPAAAIPVHVKAVADPGSPIVPLAVPVSTAMPLQPTEYRRVWIASHMNQYGDAIHGHYCEILYREAAFKAPLVPTLPPHAPVLVEKGAVQKPPGAGKSPSSNPVASPVDLRHYLQQMGIGQHGQ